MSDAAMKESLTKMGAFNDELKKAGVMKDCDGLRPSREGKRVHVDGGSRSVVDGPFTGDLVAGYWIWELPSIEEAVAWVKRCPNPIPTPLDSKSGRSDATPTQHPTRENMRVRVSLRNPA